MTKLFCHLLMKVNHVIVANFYVANMSFKAIPENFRIYSIKSKIYLNNIIMVLYDCEKQLFFFFPFLVIELQIQITWQQRV